MIWAAPEMLPELTTAGSALWQAAAAGRWGFADGQIAFGMNVRGDHAELALELFAATFRALRRLTTANQQF